MYIKYTLNYCKTWCNTYLISTLGSVKKYTSLSDDLYHFFGIVLCYQQPKYAFKK